MTSNGQNKTVVFIDGFYVDKGRLDLKLSLNLEKFKQHIETRFANCEFRYFNLNNIQEHFIEIVKNLGFSVNTKTTGAIKLGTAIACEIDNIGNDVSNIVVLGASNSQFFNAIAKMANKDNKNVFVYYFDERIARSAFGPTVELVKMDDIKLELGIADVTTKKIPETPKSKVVKAVAETVKTPTPAIVIFDGSSLDQMLAISNKTIDYKRFIEYISRINQPCQLHYINKIGTNRNLTHLISQLKCSIRIEAKDDQAIAREITNVIRHNKNKTDHFIIVCANNPEYVSEVQAIALNPSKEMTVYSFGELTDPAFKIEEINFQDFADHKKDTGIYEKETIIFVDGKSVEDWKNSIDIWLDYRELTEIAKKDLNFYELRYFGDDKISDSIINNFKNMDYNVEKVLSENGPYNDWLKFQFEIAIKRPNIDNAIIVCSETPNYITDITKLSKSLNKSIKIFSVKDLIEKDPEHKIVKAKRIKEKVDNLNNLIADVTNALTATGENDPIKIETPDPINNICDKSGNAQKLFDTINEMLLDGTLPEIKATIITGREINLEMSSTKK